MAGGGSYCSKRSPVLKGQDASRCTDHVVVVHVIMQLLKGKAQLSPRTYEGFRGSESIENSKQSGESQNGEQNLGDLSIYTVCILQVLSLCTGEAWRQMRKERNTVHYLAHTQEALRL